MVERETDITLGEFGSLLREERVRCGYTVDEVASRLKITARVVRAIEDGDMESMPHAVYASGFIRAYARILGISEDEVRPVCALLRDADEEQPQDTHLAPPRAPRSSGGSVWGFLLLFFIVAIGLGWYFREELPLDFITTLLEDTDRQATPAEPRLTPEETPTPQTQQTPQSERSGSTQPVTSVPVQATVASAPASEPVPAPQAIAPDPKGPSAQNDEASPVRTSGFTSPPEASTASTTTGDATLTLQNGSAAPTNITADTSGRKHQVILTALAECWVHSTADGTDTRQLSIQKGETFSLSFDRKLVIKLGNAGGVRIKYDGSELPPPGKPGQVKTVTFPPQDAQN